MSQLLVRTTLTADNTDVLAGTQLDQVPGPGVFTVFGASTVLDSAITITLGKDTLINAQPMPLRANGEPNINEDIPLAIIESGGGVRPVINVDEVTAMTAVLIVVFED